MACAPALRETRPPEKVSYRGKIGPYLVKKEFDEEGKAKFAAVELDIDISNISFLHNSSTIDYQLKFLDGTTENGQIFGKGSADFLYAGPKTITEVYISSNLTEPVINYGVFSDDGNGLQTVEAGERCVIQLAGDAAEFSSGMDAPNEWGQFAVAISQEEKGVEGIQAYHFGARMYDPTTGVWFSADPAEQFWNAYSYTGGNPVSFYDPTGMWSWRKFWNVMYSIANPIAYFERADDVDGTWDPTEDYDSYFFGWSWGDKTGPVLGNPDDPAGTTTVDVIPDSEEGDDDDNDIAESSGDKPQYDMTTHEKANTAEVNIANSLDQIQGENSSFYGEGWAFFNEEGEVIKSGHYPGRKVTKSVQSSDGSYERITVVEAGGDLPRKPLFRRTSAYGHTHPVNPWPSREDWSTRRSQQYDTYILQRDPAGPSRQLLEYEYWGELRVVRYLSY